MLDFSIDTRDFFYGKERVFKPKCIKGGKHIKYASSRVFRLTPRRCKLSRLHKIILRDARR